MDGKEARIAAKRAREQEEAEEAAAYERLKQELADRRTAAPHADSGESDASESEEEEEEEVSNLQLDALDDFCRGTVPRDVYAMAFNGLRVRVMTGDLTDADATSLAVGRIKVMAEEGFGPGDDKEGVCRDIWARLQGLEGELRATLDDSVAGEG